MDKSQAMIDFLQTCPTIQNNPLFFNFGNIEDNANQAIVKSDDTALNQPYIDGSVLKRYTISIDSFKSVAYNPIVSGLPDENVEGFQEVQTILDWINSQGDNQTFPDFGDDCLVEKMETLSSKPELLMVDTTTNPPMAIYRISIQLEYVDYSKRLWK